MGSEISKYSDTHKEKERQSNTKQHNTRPETTFSNEKAAFKWDSNPRLTLVDVMLYQLSY